jgi:hypothetical protein
MTQRTAPLSSLADFKTTVKASTIPPIPKHNLTQPTTNKTGELSTEEKQSFRGAMIMSRGMVSHRQLHGETEEENKILTVIEHFEIGYSDNGKAPKELKKLILTERNRLYLSYGWELGSKFRRNSFQSRAWNLAGTGILTETSISFRSFPEFLCVTDDYQRSLMLSN